MATPIVSGSAGLLWSMKQYFLTNDDIEALLEITAKDVDPPGWDQFTGWGVIDVDSAAKALANNRMLVETHSTGFANTLDWDSHSHIFYNNDGLPSGVYLGVKTYRYTKQISFPGVGYTVKPLIWARSRQTQGWSAANPQFGYGFAFIPAETVTPTGCEVVTFGYYVHANLQGEVVDEWFPCNDRPCHDAPDLSIELVQLGDLALLPPSQPSAALIESPSGIQVGWTDPNTNEQGYRLESKPAGQSTWSVMHESDSNLTSYSDLVAQGSETYDYRVRAFNQWQQNAQCSPVTTIRNKANPPRSPSAMALPGLEGPSQRTRASWLAPQGQKAGTIDHYKIKVVYPDAEEICVPCPPPQNMCCYRDDVIRWFDNIMTTNFTFCAKYTNHPMQITVYVVDTDGYLGRPSQTVTLTSGSVDVSCYEAPEGDPEAKRVAAALPESFVLDQNYPNPFNSATTLSFSLSAAQDIELSIFNTLGARVVTIVSGYHSSGSYSYAWDGSDQSGRAVASGIYFARLSSKETNMAQSRKLILLK